MTQSHFAVVCSFFISFSCPFEAHASHRFTWLPEPIRSLFDMPLQFASTASYTFATLGTPTTCKSWPAIAVATTYSDGGTPDAAPWWNSSAGPGQCRSPCRCRHTWGKGEVKPEYGESFPPDLSCLLYPVAPTSQILRHVQFTPILGLEQIFC
jgi:hypothetical protein